MARVMMLPTPGHGEVLVEKEKALSGVSPDVLCGVMTCRPARRVPDIPGSEIAGTAGGRRRRPAQEVGEAVMALIRRYAQQAGG